MNTVDTIKLKINDLKGKASSILLVPHSINDRQYDYDWANFPGMILDPFIREVETSVENLGPSEFLITRIQSWIDELQAFLEEDLKRISDSRNYPFQRSHITYFISKLTSIKSDLSETLLDEEARKDSKGSLTELTKNETILLMLYLQEAKAIISYGILKNEELCEAFQHLTGFSKDQLKKAISGDVRISKNELTTNEKNYAKLKEILLSIIDSIDRDIASFR